MASRACRTLARPLQGRVFSSQAAPARSEPSPSLPKQGPKLTKLSNGVLVASLENYAPVARVSVVVNGGSRFEEGQDVGVTHCLRIAAGLTNAKSTKFGITKNIQQIGGDMKCMSSREYMYYTVECNRDHAPVAMNYLRDITTTPAFKPWEVSDVQSQLRLDLAIMKTQPHVRVFEMLHKAAFRNALGNSLYAPKHMIGKFSSEQLMHYVKNYYTSGRMAVVGVGVDHDYLVSEANKLKPFDSTGAEGAKAQYHGGELRKATDSELTYSAIAVEGPSLASKDLLSSGILQHVMGIGPHVKWGTDNSSRVGHAVSQCTGLPRAVSCFSANYTDGGLFGFFAITQPEDSEKVLKTVTEQFVSLTKTGIKDEEFSRAKTQLKSQIAMFFEKNDNILIDLAEQALGHQQITSMEEIFKLVDGVAKDDVVKLAAKMVKGKPSMATLGNISKTPYVDQLYK